MCASAVLLVLCLGACAKATPRTEVPVAALGSTPETERRFRPLMRRWVLGTPEERQRLDLQLRNFCAQHHSDALVRVAHVLRAWNALEQSDLALARELAQDAALGPPGVPRDLAYAVIGAVERREGDFSGALARLEPLQHKMLDDFATEMLDEELAQAALGLRQWGRAVQFMEVWLREIGPGGRGRAEKRISRLLAVVPTSELLTVLAERAHAPEKDAGYRFAKKVAAEVARRAVDGGDAALARQLVNEYGSLLGRDGERVARLAANLTRGRVLARTVGLLVALSTPEMRRRSADVVAGMAFGLNVPRSGARLVTRFASVAGRDESDASIRTAMAALAADGAAVIVAGVDPKHAVIAAEFARAQSLPVMLLGFDPDFGRDGSPFVFMLGEDPAASVGQLSALLRERGARVIAGLGGPQRAGGADASMGVSLERSCVPLPRVDALRSEHVDALVVYDGAACGRELLELRRAMGVSLAVGLGVVSLGATEAPRAVRLAAGVYPVRADPDERLAVWLDSGRAAPGWWTGLGRDAATLAWAAVEGLSEVATEANAVQASRLEATSRLASARAELWTSDERSFNSNRRLERVIRVLEP